eukprot:GFYU01019635.1.p1 GENE.GFYU01019635.1~~GFYU01019635.1.p1  ORF type:complete len:336 (+),score=120.72 GFYU01019635.1:40-1047(+)
MATKAASLMSINGIRTSDSASLWNLTAAPGWTPEEVERLRYIFMKFGVGCWSKIVKENLLPGKTVAQCNLQAQRCTGQQSLKEFVGLKLDVLDVHSINSKKEGYRKNGFLVNEGENPTKEEMQRRHDANRKKFELSEKEVDELVIPDLHPENCTYYLNRHQHRGALNEIMSLRQRMKDLMEMYERKTGKNVHEEVESLKDMKAMLPSELSVQTPGPLPVVTKKVLAPTLVPAEATASGGDPMETDEAGDSNDVIKCPCGSIAEFGTMIQCELCQVWLHCSCLKMKEKEIPDVYFCKDCKKQQAEAEKQVKMQQVYADMSDDDFEKRPKKKSKKTK